MTAQFDGGILIKEFVGDPTVILNPDGSTTVGDTNVLAQQIVSVGTTPTASNPFTQQSNFISLQFAFSDDQNYRFSGCKCCYQLGNFALATLVAQWQAGKLGGLPTLSFNNPLITLAVGRGTTIAIVAQIPQVAA